MVFLLKHREHGERFLSGKPETEIPRHSFLSDTCQSAGLRIWMASAYPKAIPGAGAERFFLFKYLPLGRPENMDDKRISLARVQKGFVDQAARNFGTSESLKLQEYFVYFKISNCTIGSKDPAHGDKAFQTRAKIKRERGDTSPRTFSRFTRGD